MKPGTPKGKEGPTQGVVSAKRSTGQVITALILKKEPIVEGLVAELTRVNGELTAMRAAHEKAVLAFGDESMERTKAENALDTHRTTARILEGRLERQTAATERLERLLKLKSDFVARMVHQLKTPLTVIVGYVTVLQDSISNPDARGMLDLMGKAGGRMKETINMMLDFFKAEAGELKVRRERVDVGGEMAAVTGLMQSLADAKKVKLALDCPEQVYAELDPRLLHHVMVNLISNGINYNRSDATGLVTVAVKKKGGRVGICVSDTGVGIKKDDIPRLFTPFNRLESTQGIDGTGLGLAVVKTFTELMGGTINVESESGKGSAFTVSFPATND